MKPEFVDESFEGADDSCDDVVDVGTDRRVPRWVFAALVALAAAIAVVVVVQGQPPGKHHPVAAPSSSATHDVAQQSASTVPSEIEQTFSSIYHRALDAAPATDIVRTGSATPTCRLVPIGTSPQQVAGAALVRQLPGYRLVDSARIIDQGAGLCALQVRARNAAGTVAVALVSSPTPIRSGPVSNVIQSHSAPLDGALVEYVQFTTSDGWTVIVGTSGPEGGQPSTRDLGEVAVSAALRW